MPKSSFHVKNLLKAVFVWFVNFAALIESYFPEDSWGHKYGFCLDSWLTEQYLATLLPQGSEQS